ncbi:MAG TPA: hypothetical protein VIV66_01325 [Pyrinomonadaceae bacterium]
MKKSTFSMCAMFLCSVAVICAIVDVKAVPQAGLTYAIVMDSSGNLIGQLAGDAIPSDGIKVDVTLNIAEVPVRTRTAAPTGVTMSTQAPAFTAAPTTVIVKVRPSLPIGFCSSGDYYNRGTGLCADGKNPYKVVPIGSLSDPKAQTPTIVCRSPMVPTFNSASKVWQCIVTTGFKTSQL